jgi:hypothetical protein
MTEEELKALAEESNRGFDGPYYEYGYLDGFKKAADILGLTLEDVKPRFRCRGGEKITGIILIDEISNPK